MICGCTENIHFECDSLKFVCQRCLVKFWLDVLEFVYSVYFLCVHSCKENIALDRLTLEIAVK